MLRSLVGSEMCIRDSSTTDGSVYTLVETAVITTLSNDGDNYEKNDFMDSDGIYDLSEFNNVSVDLINDVINDVFDTDDRIEINLDGIRRNSKFVNLGDTIDATDTTAIVVPFSPTSGSGQSVSLTLSNSTSTIEYNNLTETLNIESGNYHGNHVTSKLILEFLGLFFDSLAMCTILPILELNVPTNTSAFERRSMSEKRYTNDLYS